ncbi:SO_0444 family Cu/Zn efflux transporter [Pseudodesulfovibrio sp. F-1]|uniref:SO_0444 family Cu/Zn efflux transporter n=2 Tax=Pseudodesulfovibrio alkaliphilus TaxID=2661613 RepID=A0A7K1KL93_9BACT|nr:SO_0444 family Cu/Zn efflux transporter [Pseudodesulfovibrio alkaliphilus]
MLVEIVVASWHVLEESAPYVLLGFFVAGLLKAFVPDAFMARHLGGRSFGSVVKAAVIGVPLPLCSCGVLPAALGLRRQGASKGATTAFMISTPETGVDSMAVTYALIDPIMTVVRPVAATVTAVSAGILVNLFPGREEREAESDHSLRRDNGPAFRPVPSAEASIDTEPAARPLDLPYAHSSEGQCGCHGGEAQPERIGIWTRFILGMRHAFGEMLADIGKWLMVGIVVAGAIAVAVPEDALSEYIGTGFPSYLIMLVVALPLYVCATASTPIAASLLLKGLSPGAALVFLLAGPATNGATITVMLKAMGRRTAVIYVAAIVGCSLTLAWLVDRLYIALGLDIRAVVVQVDETLPEWVGVASALVLLLLVGRSLMRRECGCGAGHCAGSHAGH